MRRASNTHTHTSLAQQRECDGGDDGSGGTRMSHGGIWCCCCCCAVVARGPPGRCCGRYPPSGAPHGPCGLHDTLDSLPDTHTTRTSQLVSSSGHALERERFAPRTTRSGPARTEGPEIRPDAQQQQKRSVRESPLSLLTRPRAARCCCLSWWWSWRWSTLIGWWAGR